MQRRRGEEKRRGEEERKKGEEVEKKMSGEEDGVEEEVAYLWVIE